MLKTLKFGGTSMANAESIGLVRKIIEGDPAARYIVVSAPGKRAASDTKVTDLLIKRHEETDAAAKKALSSKIRTRFDEIIRGLKIDLDLTEDFAEIEHMLSIGCSYDYLVSRGEYLSAKILAALLNYEFVDAAEIIFFTADGALDADKTQHACSKRLNKASRAVIPGFYGSKPNGEIKTFSRGGSDVSGAIIARAVKANVYENWTDVDGFMVVDPRIVKNPQIIDMLTYRELRELSYMGASVLHPESVFPVRKANIPIHIRNTFRPEADGTMIVPSKDFARGMFKREARTITGIAGRKNFVGIHVEKQMMNSEIGFCRKLLDVLYRHNVSLEHMPTGIDTVTLIIDAAHADAGEIKTIVREITDVCSPNLIEVSEPIALIAVVGHGMSHRKGTASRVCKSLSDSEINIRMIDQGSSELNIIVGVENADYEKALAALYDEFVLVDL